MKFFIVNVNNCLPMSQYAPFFYEHIYKGDLVMLEDIEDTCQLEKTYWELLSHMNRKPFPKRQGVILIFCFVLLYLFLCDATDLRHLHRRDATASPS